MTLDEKLAEAVADFDTTPYGEGITIEPYMNGSSLLINVRGKDYGDNDQKEFLSLVEAAKIHIRQYFAKKGWEDEL